MKVYLCDLTHDVGLRTRVVPLGIATLACAVKDTCKEKISTELFVYPKKIIEKLKSDPPNVIALSNYIWNSKLSLKIAKLAKKIDPNILTVMGGPHARTDPEGLKKFLNKNSFIDAYIPFEGEAPFVALIEACLQKKTYNIKELGNVQGSYLNLSDYKFERLMVESDKSKEVYNSPYYTINRYSSPYLNGMLDKFLDDPKLSPLLESNRGCPYSCTFCAWGIGSGNKLIKKNLDRFLDEMWHVGKRTRNDVWFMADANFGIVKDDIKIAENLREINKKYGSPKTFIYNTAKNTAKLVFEAANVLGDAAPINIAVQSFDPKVLKHIKRKNLKDKEIVEFVKMHQKQGRLTTTDLLVPQSGESLQSHLHSIRTAFNYGFDVINTNIIRMLPGTEMESDADREKFGFKTLWRPMDSGFGIYENEFIFETDESIISSNDITEEEMYSLKKVHFLTLLFWLHGIAKPLLKLALINKTNPIDIVLSLAKDTESKLSKKILNPLEEEYRNEWFKSEEELIEYYNKPEINKKLHSGELEMKKLNLKYFSHALVETDMVYESIATIKEYMEKNMKIDKNIIDVVYKITLDNLKLDLLNEELTKTVKYKVSEKAFQYLKETNIISENTKYEDGGFNLTYEISREKFDLMTKRLKQLNFNSNPKDALYTAISVGIAKFLYQVRTDQVVKYSFEKNPFHRSKKIDESQPSSS